MPTVPQYRRQVQQAAIPVPRAQAQIVDTQGLERGLSQAARAATDIMEEQQQRADTTTLIEADNKLTEWQNNAFYNKETGVYTRKGKNALDVTNQTLGEFEKFQQEIGSSLTNDRQRARFNQIVQSRKGSMSQDLNRYEYGQHQQYMNDTDSASIKLSQDSAVLNYADPDRVSYFRQKAMDVVTSQAERNGWSPEVLEASKQKVTSGMYSDVLKRQASDDPYKAQAALKTYSKYLTADDLTQVGGSIEAKVDRLQQKAEMARLRAEAKADRALNKFNAQIASGIPATDEMVKAWGSQVRGTPAQEEFNELVNQQVETQKVLRLPIDQQIAFVNQKTAELQKSGGTVADGANINRLGRAIESNVKMMSDSPLDYFQQRLGGDVQPLDLNAPDVGDQLSGRVEAIQGMRQKFGPSVAMKPLLPQEAKQLTAQLEQMSPDQKSQLFAKLHSSIGDDQAYAGAMQQIAPDSPILALSGLLAGKQRSMTLNSNWFSPDDVVSSGDVAKTMALGESILNKSKAQKAEDGTSKFPIPKQADFQVELDRQLNGVFAGQPQSYGLAAQAVKSYYTGVAAQKGDISGEIDRGLLRQAIKATVGEVAEFNGSSTIAPWGMPADTFVTTARQRIADTMRAQGMSETDLAAANAMTLRQAKDGVYYVMQGQQFKYGTDGKPLVINMNEAGR